jgi:hypothetical protein
MSKTFVGWQGLLRELQMEQLPGASIAAHAAVLNQPAAEA